MLVQSKGSKYISTSFFYKIVVAETCITKSVEAMNKRNIACIVHIPSSTTINTIVGPFDPSRIMMASLTIHLMSQRGLYIDNILEVF